VSTHEQTIAHTRSALAKCDDVVGALAGVDSMHGEIESHLHAAFDGTDVITADQYYRLLSDQINGALQTAQRLKEYLEGALVRFQAG
jgi:hypothetical protein